MSRPKRPPRPAKDDRWDDPDSDASDKEDRQEAREAKLEKDHAKWGAEQGTGGDDDDDDDDDLKGSDSDGDGERDKDLGADLIDDLLGRRAPPKQTKKEEDEGLWDPLAGLAPRKKRKVGEASTAAPQGGYVSDPKQKQQASNGVKGSGTAGLPQGTAVCLHGLQKAPALNGQSGTVEGPVDGVTGRCPVLLLDGTVKSLRQENLRQVHTGSVVRLKGLQSAAELNGRIGECGRFDLTSQRYDVTLADEPAGAPPKRVKECNLEVMRRFATVRQTLSAQRRLFTWKDVLEKARQRQRRAWSEQLKLLKESKLPLPRLFSSDALCHFVQQSKTDPKGARKTLLSKSVLAEKAPVDADGFLTCRLLAVSIERDACCPADAPKDDLLKRLGVACRELASRNGGEPMYFLFPTLCVKALPCLREAASCAWPLYLQLCQALLCIDSEYRAAKTWCRIDQMVAGSVLSKPVYVLPQAGVSSQKASKAAGDDASGWLLSDVADATEIGAPSDGHVLPAERQLTECIAAEVLPGGWRKKASLTTYRL